METSQDRDRVRWGRGAKGLSEAARECHRVVTERGGHSIGLGEGVSGGRVQVLE